MQPSQLLSRTRLRLISSMFSQMCNAVAACHDQQVYHRDIKPENFIVTDGWTTIDGRTERKVVVKLTDFGLSTTDVDSSDMDCGSAPYMSYECRNNVAPTYRPRAADVWSLGIVLINMLYHYNPWTDTAQHSCSSFDVYRQNPVGFFMERFAGMTRPVAEMLAHHVFNILEHSTDDSARISAAEFGIWAKDIPDLLGNPPSVVPRHQRAVSVSSTHGHPISSSIPVSHRPSSRQASQAATNTRTSIPASRTHSRTTSTFDKIDISELSTVIDQEVEEEPEGMEEQEIVIEGMASRSTSTNKRRKRGARKGKGPGATPTTPKDETLDTLANASQALAREISRASRASSHRSAASMDSKMFDSSSIGVPPVPPLPSPPLTAPPAPFNVLTKKTSKWRLAFGKSTVSAAGNGGDEPPSPDMPSSLSTAVSLPMSATASNVTTLIMGLSAPPLSAPLPTTQGNDSQISLTWGRGRRNRESPGPPSNSSRRTGSDSSGPSSPPSGDRWPGEHKSDRAGSPNSTRSGRPLASSSSSMTSNNWRNSMSTTSSAGTSTSAFTHYSNSSLRSVSTNATSISSGSWRTGSKSISSHSPQRSPNSANNSRPPNVPRNVKIMDGVPWELGQLPRHLHPSPVEDMFGQPPVRKIRPPRKPKDIKLDTITERPPANRKSPESVRRDASTSTTDLGTDSRDDGDYPKKVQKGQINALAKMLSALRR